MEYIAPASVAGSKHGTKLLSFCSVYAFLRYIRNYLSGSSQNYEKHMGFCTASCMVQYGFRRDVYLNFLVRVSEYKDLDSKSVTDSGDYVYIGCILSERVCLMETGLKMPKKVETNY